MAVLDRQKMLLRPLTSSALLSCNALLELQAGAGATEPQAGGPL